MRKLIASFIATAALAGAQEAPEGLRLTFAAGGGTDSRVVERVALYVPEGQPPSPFLPPGKFTATCAIPLESVRTDGAKVASGLKSARTWMGVESALSSPPAPARSSLLTRSR